MCLRYIQALLQFSWKYMQFNLLTYIIILKLDCLLLVKLKCIYYLVIGDRFIASSIFIDWYTVWPHLPIMIINSIMSLKIQYTTYPCISGAYCSNNEVKNCLCCWPSLYIIQYDFFLGKKIITKLKHLSILKSNSSHGVIFQAQNWITALVIISFCVLYLTCLLKFLAFI